MNSRGLSLPVATLVVALVGTAVAFVLALLTFGVQATISPDHVPLAVGSADPATAPALSQLVQGVASHGGDQVAWRQVRSRAEAENLLDAKQVYGALLLSPAQGGVTATVLVSGAVNPNATAVAEQVLTSVALGLAAPAQVVTIHPASAAGRTLPLAATALLWLAALVANILSIAMVPRLRKGAPIGRVGVIGVAGFTAILSTGLVVGLAWLWDSSVSFGWDLVGFLLLVAFAFSLLQGAVLRWLGLPGLAILGPLYLMAPAVAGLPPELINPTYRALLWSWTPFRFSTEAIRSFLFVGGGAPDVQPALVLFAAIAIGGALLIAARPKGAAAVV